MCSVATTKLTLLCSHIPMHLHAFVLLIVHCTLMGMLVRVSARVTQRTRAHWSTFCMSSPLLRWFHPQHMHERALIHMHIPLHSFARVTGHAHTPTVQEMSVLLEILQRQGRNYSSQQQQQHAQSSIYKSAVSAPRVMQVWPRRAPLSTRGGMRSFCRSTIGQPRPVDISHWPACTRPIQKDIMSLRTSYLCVLSG